MQFLTLTSITHSARSLVLISNPSLINWLATVSINNSLYKFHLIAYLLCYYFDLLSAAKDGLNLMKFFVGLLLFLLVILPINYHDYQNILESVLSRLYQK